MEKPEGVDPIPPFLQRVTELERSWPVSREQAEALATAGLSDEEVGLAVDLLSQGKALGVALQALEHRRVGAALARKPRPLLPGQKRKYETRLRDPKTPYAQKLMQDFQGVKHGRR